MVPLNTRLLSPARAATFLACPRPRPATWVSTEASRFSANASLVVAEERGLERGVDRGLDDPRLVVAEVEYLEGLAVHVQAICEGVAVEAAPAPTIRRDTFLRLISRFATA